LVTIIVPYSKTPSNIVYDTLNYVAPPVAIARAVKAAKARRFDEFATLLGKSVVGFSLYAFADLLIKNGLATAGIGDDEKKEKEMFYSLFPYNTINLSALQRYMNGEETSPRDGDVFVDYSKAGPIGAIIGARASYWAVKKQSLPVLLTRLPHTVRWRLCTLVRLWVLRCLHSSLWLSSRSWLTPIRF
jgi:hypothetical protein